MSTPPLSEATGAEHSEVLIKDVVERIKCEVSDAFDEKIEQTQFKWLAGWTAHIDLSLAINDNAGISPNGSYTNFRRSAVNTDAGPNVLPQSKTFPFSYPLVTQFFSVSAGANLSGQAVRTETVSFTLSLEELKAWRREIELREAGRPPEKKTCFPQSTGLTGNLGLKEWTDSAFFPVAGGLERDLNASVYKSQWKNFDIPRIGENPFDGYKYLAEAVGAARKARAARPDDVTMGFRKSRPKPEVATAKRCDAADANVHWEIGDGLTPSPSETLSANEMFDQVAQWQKQLKSLQTATASSLSTIESNAEKINSNILTVKAKLDDNKQYDAIVSPFIKRRYDEARHKMYQALKYVEFCADYKKTLDSAQTLSELILPSLYQVGSQGTQDNWCNPKYYCANAGIKDDPAFSCDGDEAAKAGDKASPPYGFCRAKSCPNAGTSQAYTQLKKLIQKLHDRAAAVADKDPKNAPFEKGALVCAENLPWLAENVNVFVSDIPNQIDPPVDSVLHSLQFVISYGANVTPSWTLLQWKGPGQSGNFLSASGVRTHNLQLALGPRSGQASISSDATRLITNQTVKSLGN
jgi:hypothetical protein